MKLTKEQIDRAAAHLQEKCNRGCPMCGGVEWVLDEFVFFLASPPDPAQRIQVARAIGQQAPPEVTVSRLVTAVCQGCAFVATYGADAMGLFAQGPADG